MQQGDRLFMAEPSQVFQIEAALSASGRVSHSLCQKEVGGLFVLGLQKGLGCLKVFGFVLGSVDLTLEFGFGSSSFFNVLALAGAYSSTKWNLFAAPLPKGKPLKPLERNDKKT